MNDMILKMLQRNGHPLYAALEKRGFPPAITSAELIAEFEEKGFRRVEIAQRLASTLLNIGYKVQVKRRIVRGKMTSIYWDSEKICKKGAVIWVKFGEKFGERYLKSRREDGSLKRGNFGL